MFKPYLLNSFLILLFTFTACGSLLATAPDTIPKTFHYRLLAEAAIYRCDITGARLQPDSLVHTAPAYSTFTKIGIIGEYVIIRFWEWRDPDTTLLNKYSVVAMNQAAGQEFYLLSQSDFDYKTQARYSLRPDFTMGTVLIPLKLRSKPFTFSPSITLGPAAGARFRLSPYTTHNFFNILGSFGITHLPLDSIQTQGVINQTSDRAAVTLSLGSVFEFSNAQIGIFIGWDYVSDNELLRWRYQGKPWLSIGLGYSILSRGSNNTTVKEGVNK